MSHPFLNVVGELSHHNASVNFPKVAAKGVLGVIYKSTHGMTGRDETHDERRMDAKAAGLLWGSFHFGTGVATGEEHASQFLNRTKPEKGDINGLNIIYAKEIAARDKSHSP